MSIFLKEIHQLEDAFIAQMVEHETLNLRVRGSIPLGGLSFFPFFFFWQIKNFFKFISLLFFFFLIKKIKKKRWRISFLWLIYVRRKMCC